MDSGPEPEVRTVALRTAGELGRQDLVSMCAAAGADEDPACRAWAGWSAVVLGSRGTALEALTKTVRDAGPDRLRAFWLALQAMSTNGAHALLQDLARDPQQARWLIQGSGIAGDPMYVPWLVKQMANDRTTRVAGEGFSFITGVDLSRQQPIDRNRRVMTGAPTTIPPIRMSTWIETRDCRGRTSPRSRRGGPTTAAGSRKAPASSSAAR